MKATGWQKPQSITAWWLSGMVQAHTALSSNPTSPPYILATVQVFPGSQFHAMNPIQTAPWPGSAESGGSECETRLNHDTSTVVACEFFNL